MLLGKLAHGMNSACVPIFIKKRKKEDAIQIEEHGKSLYPKWKQWNSNSICDYSWQRTDHFQNLQNFDKKCVVLDENVEPHST